MAQKKKQQTFTRRDVLKFAFASAGVLGGWKGTGPIVEQVYAHRLRKLHEQWLREPNPVQTVQIVPEYERSAENVLVVFDNFRIPLEQGRKNSLNERQFRELSDILAALPEYATIHMIASDEAGGDMQKQVATLHPSLRERIVKCPIGTEQFGSFSPLNTNVYWAQDVCEAARCSGKPAIVLPLCRDYLPESPASAFINTHLPSLQKRGIENVLAPVVFDGGNVIPDVVNGKRYLFVGRNELANTRALYSGLAGISLSEGDAQDLFKRSFGVDEVAVLGPTIEDFLATFDQSGNLFQQAEPHLREGLPAQNLVLYDDRNRPAMTLKADGEVTLWKGAHRYDLNWLMYKKMIAQSHFGFHIDMAMVTHPGGSVSVAELQPMTSGEERERIEYHKIVLEAHGKTGQALVRGVDAKVGSEILMVRHTIAELKRSREQLERVYGVENVHSFKTTARHAVRFQAYSNTPRFRNKETGTYHALMPVFPTKEPWIRIDKKQVRPNVHIEEYKPTGEQETYEDTGCDRLNREHFAQRGYDVQTIRNATYLKEGNVNCVLNILT